jgi:ribonucleoside-diphosphate reductase alpha chain
MLIHLSENARQVLEVRYLQRDGSGQIMETPEELFQRVARSIATIYRRAWEWGLKGITVFRYGSKGQQVLELGEGESGEEREHFAQCDPYVCKL